MYWYLKTLKQYADFKGRARRKEFWLFGLFSMLFCILAATLDNLLGTDIEVGGISTYYGLFYILFVLAIFIPSLAVTVRRLHDVGKSGWMYFIVLIPLVGSIWLFVLFLKNSQPGANKYGPNPKEEIFEAC